MSTEPLPHASFPADEPPDLEARRVALDPSRSFAVSAPAGSGKTGLLTQRVRTLLARCQEPEEVLAITVTREAAGELQDRILHAEERRVGKEGRPRRERRRWTKRQ